MSKQAYTTLITVTVAILTALICWSFSDDEALLLSSNQPACGELATDVSTSARPSSEDKSAEDIQPEECGAGSDTQPSHSKIEESLFDLHIPEYGPDLQRGGARITFEVLDANGSRLNLGTFSCMLHRRIGTRWVAEDARVNIVDHTIECLGLGRLDLPSTGLEPGTYELTVTSVSHGNVRHKFDVIRGEVSTRQVSMSTYSRVVSFEFRHPDGTPVEYINWKPYVHSVSKALPYAARSRPSTVKYRDPPTKPDPKMGGSGTYRSGGVSGWVWSNIARGDPPRYRTDNGRWWVRVMAGATNKLFFQFDKKIWGQQWYEYSGDFTGVGIVVVELKTCEDFGEQVLKSAKIVEKVEPGNIGIVSETVPVLSHFDAISAPVAEGRTRVVFELAGLEGVRAEWGDSGSYSGRFMRKGKLHWRTFKKNDNCSIRFTSASGQSSQWETLDVSTGGLLYIIRTLETIDILLPTATLSPTIRAFTHSVDLILKGSTRDNSTVTRKLRLTGGYNHLKCTLLGSGKWMGNGNVDVQSEIFGASRFHRPRRLISKTVSLRGSGLTFNGRYPSPKGVKADPAHISNELKCIIPDGSVASLQQYLQLTNSGTLAFRAVGPDGGGLPGVQALVFEADSMTVAEAVKECSVSEIIAERPMISRADHIAYAAELDALESNLDDNRLRALVGNNIYDSFDSDQQRLWFARHGAWYDRSRQVESDDHGYAVNDSLGLEPGKTYVLYFWSGSRDDHKPDKKIVFRVDDDGMADLGIIRLPTFVD